MRLALLAAAALCLVTALPAQAASPEAQVRKVMAAPAFKATTATFARDHDRMVGEIIELTEIPAPPFKEQARGEAYLAKFRALGLQNVTMDAEGNVTGVRPGTKTGGKGPYVVLAAHLDTVFPAGTDVKVRREGTKLMAPGIGDDTRSLAVLLAYVRGMNEAGVKTRSDILFVGNVGEEGPGDLRGVRYLFNKSAYAGKITTFFSMDGLDPSRVTATGVGSKRYKVTFHGPGGHSYGAFGVVNPMAALAKAVTSLYEIKPPTKPKTTYSASVTGGGTSVNSIPGEAWMEFDMRSESADELTKLDGQFNQILTAAADGENAARDTRYGKISFDPKVIGFRPAGHTDPKAEVVLLTTAAAKAMGYEPKFDASSTDSNMPMSLGIPAVTIGAGGTGGRAHALDEWIDVEPVESVRGMTVGLAALLSVAGLD